MASKMWIKSDANDQWFIKESENNWAEYQDGEIFAEFTEIQYNNEGSTFVILRKTDGLYVKLTEGNGYFGDCENNIDTCFCTGNWSDQTQKQMNPSASASINSKWVKTDEENQYFIKISNNIWFEYQNAEKFAEFTEIQYNNEGSTFVILRKTDGLYVKLTEGNGYFGDCENNIDTCFCTGNWSDQTQKQMNPSASASINSKWVKTDEENQYFIKISNNIWFEYQNAEKFAEFTEIQYNNEGSTFVILRKTDGLYVKLTEGYGYFGDCENNIDTCFCTGNWSNQIQKQMNSSASASINSKWVKTDEENQYFKKISNNIWFEYQNGEKFAEFTEKYFNNSGSIYVIMEKSDGLWIKLTEEAGYFGLSETDIYSWFCSGCWENESDSYDENGNNDAVDNTNVNDNISRKIDSTTTNESINEKAEEYIKNAFKHIQNIKFQEGLNEIIKAISIDPDNDRCKTLKDLIEKILKCLYEYNQLIANGNRHLFNNKYEEAKNYFKSALSVYTSVANDSNILGMFQDANLNVVDYLKKGKEQINGLLALANEESSQIDEKVKNMDINKRVNDAFKEELDDIHNSVLKHIRYMKFSDALNAVKNGIKLDKNNERFQTNFILLSKVTNNIELFNNLIAEGNKCLLNKDHNSARAKYNEALNAYLDTAHDPKILGLFRDAELDIVSYINNGNEQINELNKLTSLKKPKYEDAHEFYQKGLNEIKMGMNYSKALNYFNSAASLNVPDFDIEKDIDCLKKLLKNIEKYYEHIAKGLDFMNNKDFAKAIEEFQVGSNAYLELIKDTTFIKLHEGNVYDFIKANQADNHLKEAKEKAAKNVDVVPTDDNNDFWNRIPVIGANND